MDEQSRQALARVKKTLAAERERAAGLAQLIRQESATPQAVDLWSLSPRELDQEMANRLTALNEDINTRPEGKITSHRRFAGHFIVLAKRILRWLGRPYTNLVLARQVPFNENLVAFHLASFIRMRGLEERLAALEEKIAGLEESLDNLLEGRSPEDKV